MPNAVSTKEKPRNVAKKGFGTVMVEKLREVDHASTEELAKLAGVTVEQAYSRLMFLQSQEKMVVSSGKGSAKLWSMADKAPPPVPKVEATGETSAAAAFNKNHGWKPSLRKYQVVEGAASLKKGDTLLVEYPEGWRHTALVTLTRDPDVEKGVAQAWDIRNHVFTYIPVGYESMKKANVKVVQVTSEKDVIALEGA
jgi:hypothetical protein